MAELKVAKVTPEELFDVLNELLGDVEDEDHPYSKREVISIEEFKRIISLAGYCVIDWEREKIDDYVLDCMSKLAVTMGHLIFGEDFFITDNKTEKEEN